MDFFFGLVSENSMYLDDLDNRIIKLLSENSKLTFKEIGDQIHMTGQAVGVRVNRLMDDGIIEKFTIKINQEKLGVHITALIKVFMKKLEHQKMLLLIEEKPTITEAYRTGADCCYFLKVETSSQDELNQLLDSISEFATYQLTLSIGKLK